MNTRAFAVLLVAFVLTVPGGRTAEAGDEALAPGCAVAGDLARLQGCWRATAGAGRELKVSLDVVGSGVKVQIITPQGATIRAEGELRLDETTEPRTLDWVNLRVAGQERFPDIPAIYALRGPTLTVCNGSPSGARPREFRAGDGVLADVVVFQRIDEADRTRGGQP